MITLGLDTSTARTAVALHAPDGVRAERAEGAGEDGRPQHTSRALALADELLRAAGMGFADVERVAVGTGPGTFTGLRVGIATAQALACATGAVLVGVSSLQVLAVGARRGAPGEGAPILAVIDARRGEAFAALYDGAHALTAAAALAPAALAALVRDGAPEAGRLRAVGDGAVRFREVLEQAGADVAPDGSRQHDISALALCELSLSARGAEPATIGPAYLRRPDAEISARATP